jgi:hypothetical protein
MKMEQIECSETSAYKIQTPGNHPEENIQPLNFKPEMQRCGFGKQIVVVVVICIQKFPLSNLG